MINNILIFYFNELFIESKWKYPKWNFTICLFDGRNLLKKKDEAWYSRDIGAEHVLTKPQNVPIFNESFLESKWKYPKWNFTILNLSICWMKFVEKERWSVILSGIFWEILEQSTCWRSLRTFPFSTNRSSNLNGNIRSETLKTNLSICWMKFVEKERWGVILSGMFWEILEQSTCWRSLRTSASWILRMLNGLRKRHDMLRVKNCPASKGSRNVTILASMKNGRRVVYSTTTRTT